MTENISNGEIHSKHVFYNFLQGQTLPDWLRNNPSLNVHPLAHRFRFADFLSFAKSKNTVYILTNADIALGAMLGFCRLIKGKELWALSRWNTGRPPQFTDRSTQDTWIVRGSDFPPFLTEKCNFSLGLPGCDNAFAGLFKEAGYQVRNYALSIRTDHHHASQVRTYGTESTIPRPYYYPTPEKISLLRRLCGRLRQVILPAKN